MKWGIVSAYQTPAVIPTFQ